MTELLQLKGLKKYFLHKEKRQIVQAVNDVSLTMKQGYNLGLVGESGCGKTTLARLIVKLMNPDGGLILFQGQDIMKYKRRQMRLFRRKVQMVFQDPYSSLDPRFSVRRILGEAPIFESQLSRREKEEKMKRILKLVQMPSNILNRYPHEFSGGERQRVAIARALMSDPQLLVLDEAVSSLDVIIQEQIIQLLADLQKKINITYLTISHNLRVVKKVSHEIAVMYKGRIVELAKQAELFHNPGHPYTKILLSAAINYTIENDGVIFLPDKGEWEEIAPEHFVLK